MCPPICLVTVWHAGLCWQGVSVCGQDNCELKSGGRWDETDDCCERRCSASQPCAEGQGHCESDQDCAKPGWARCGDNLCLNSQYFPLAKYPNNTAWFGFTSSGSHFSRLANTLFYPPSLHWCIIFCHEILIMPRSKLTTRKDSPLFKSKPD